MLPENTILGTLEYIEVYDFYDTPQFFSCKNEKEEIYLGLSVEKVNSSYIYLFALIEDPNLLALTVRGLNTPDFYLDLDYKVYKVIISGTLNVVTEIHQSEVESYFSDYIQNRREKHKAFADFLKEIHGELNND